MLDKIQVRRFNYMYMVRVGVSVVTFEYILKLTLGSRYDVVQMLRLK